MTASKRALATAALVSFSLLGVAGVAGATPATAAPTAVISAPRRETGPTTNPIVASAIAALDSLRVGDTPTYYVHLYELGDAVAATTGLESGALVDVWARADATRMTALLSALTQVGVSYRKNSAEPGGGFDCSGLVSWAWAQAGVTLSHQSRSIINEVPATSLEAILPGDVIWYPGHIEIALGVGDSFVHSPSPGKTVEVKKSHRSGKRLKFGNPLG